MTHQAISAAIALIVGVLFLAPVNAQEVAGNGVILPTVVKEVKPEYTRAAMQEKIQGSVWLKCVVSDAGDVTEVQVSKSLDTQFGLDEAAIAAAQQWKFRPGTKAGKPVPVQITLELTFTLK
jgi:periplasmic protein TonB